MLNTVSVDHLLTFIAATDEGSFSAAGRKLRRAQSVVSHTLASLEGQLGVRLFDRRSRRPVLTEHGLALLAEARAVVASVDHLRARAKSLSSGLEAEVAVVVDVMFPIHVLTAAVIAFQDEFPDIPLRLYVEALGAVLQPVLEGQAAFGIMGSLPMAPTELTRERVLGVRMEMVASPSHPLAAYEGRIPRRVLDRHVQLVLTDRSKLSYGREFGVLSPRTWRLADLGAKHAFLRAGLGWGSMPLSVIESDLAEGLLARLALEESTREFVMPMSIAYPTASPPGPAGRWLVERLKQEAVPHEAMST
jgi:DNA-binding transcriptional LysR family regulator